MITIKTDKSPTIIMENNGLSGKLKNINQRVLIKNAIGIIIGGIGGYLYYIKIGCASGTCPLTSNPYISILWGGLVGYLIADLIKFSKPNVDSETKE